MNNNDNRSKIYSFRTGEGSKSESELLDDALAEVVEDVAHSLQGEEEMLQQEATVRRNQRVVAGILVLLLFLGTKMLLTPSSQTETTSVEKPLVAGTRASADSPDNDFVPIVESLLKTGNFRMQLPRGFEWEVRLIALGDRQYRMISKRQLTMLGVYELQGNRLIMVEPDDKRLTEFQWIVSSNDNLELIAEPPATKTGAQYLGTTLSRKTEPE